MALLDLFTRNRAELTPDANDPDLRPVIVSLPPIHAVTWASQVIKEMPLWSVVTVLEQRGMIHATHRTRVFGFVDDVDIGFEEHPAGTSIVARSKSRIGKGDLGQNARNLRSLSRALRCAEEDRTAHLGTGSGASGR